MEFGKLDNVDHVDWALPPDDKKALSYLPQFQPKPRRYFLGTPTWGSRTWLGKIYPSDAKSHEFLHFYSRAFSTIELNTTHYRLPTTELVKGWCEQVPKEFRFCPKFPQTISHERNGILDQTLLQEWQRALSDFGENLGVSFLQLPPYFSYEDRAVLHRFIEAWPSELPLALEFRHTSWFTNNTILPALVDYLQKKNVGLVITDVAGRRDVLHTSISAPFVLLRFIGNEMHPSDLSRVDDWSERLKHWSQIGLNQVYFFAHEPDDIMCPELSEYVTNKFNEVLGTEWESPLKQGQDKQVTLF